MELITVAELAEHRADALSRMTSRCTVWRKTGAKTKVDGLNVDQWEVVHTDLPLRIAEAGSRTITINGITYETANGRGDVPALTDDIRDDDHVDVTVGEWTGTAWKIVKAVKKDQATARRLPMEGVARPAGWPTP